MTINEFLTNSDFLFNGRHVKDDVEVSIFNLKGELLYLNSMEMYFEDGANEWINNYIVKTFTIELIHENYFALELNVEEIE